MAYIHDGSEYTGFSGPGFASPGFDNRNFGSPGFGGPGCGPSCACGPCQQQRGALSEFYYEGEGGDHPRLTGWGLGGFNDAPAPATVTRELRVVVKSYIAPIGWHAGSPYCGGLLSPAADLRLRALAALTDAGFSENPRTDAKDKHYRLYSARTFTVTCSGGNVVSVVPSPIDTDSGKECIPGTSKCLQAPSLIVSGVTARVASPTAFDFSWTAKGRPNRGVEPGMQLVCPRTSVFIWHNVAGRIECAGGEPRIVIRLSGSRFPSHRVFVNGVIQPPTIPQGSFSNLWVPAGISDPTLVR